MANLKLSRLNVHLPAQLLADLEDLRYLRSKQMGRRVSTRALTEEAIAAFLASAGKEVRP
jgi:hypothetical protein